MPQKRVSLHPLNKRVTLKVAARPLASSDKAVLLHEDGYQPVLYLPMTDIPDGLLAPSDTRTHCPHKGDARYFDLRLENATIKDAAWNYPVPIPGMEPLASLVAFYRDKLDAHKISLVEEVNGE
ncbi:DUF427 domain-containing protein [Limibacillus sp. MBR-115]|uniref:DUF427 domain-containing protein n=1 Tax=Limibacillus sp. MBR-115 TaxID=3156465 RepID=UPI00339266D2